ncbi:MAG: cyclic pyranopterin monophosphate synthase accessory protein [Hyphococcus sp.]|nr:MAG: cyclic pyranopterin monophosphate synthase accessory protein [Marinicaulis sp.]
MGGDLTHFDKTGRPRMVDVSGKASSARTATACGYVVFSPQAYKIVCDGGVKKGDVVSVAELAGIMGAKRTSDLIPLCHPLYISGVSVKIERDDAEHRFQVTADVRTDGATGVEMEALTAVMTACLTIYDMAKAVDKSIMITDVVLLEKTGGKSGDYVRKE